MKYAIEKFTNFHIVEISPILSNQVRNFRRSIKFWFVFFDKFPNAVLLICKESIENDIESYLRNIAYNV